MKRTFVLLLAALAAVPLAAATCPFNIPVVTIPPQQINGYSWGPVIRPMNDACVSSIAVEPANASEWYVGGENSIEPPMAARTGRRHRSAARSPH
jgi:hypothetical protein